MADYITIDGGTTNTRIYLVSDYKIKDFKKINIGARKSADNNMLYKAEIKKNIEILLKDNNKREDDISCILASGMITSEFGLCNLEHISVPAGIKELHDTMVRVNIKDISEKIPFVFIRGVKISSSDFETCDMMRGEETELMGILKQTNSLYILPGSHSKIISVNNNWQITEFKTMLTGEMFAALAENTILKASLDLNCDEIKQESLLKGYNYALKDGVNAALFKTRILSNVFTASENEIYSYFLGVVLCDEVNYLLKQNLKNIYIGGKKQLKNALFVLLTELSNKNIFMLSEADIDFSCVNGIIKIYEYKG